MSGAHSMVTSNQPNQSAKRAPKRRAPNCTWPRVSTSQTKTTKTASALTTRKAKNCGWLGSASDGPIRAVSGIRSSSATATRLSRMRARRRRSTMTTTTSSAAARTAAVMRGLRTKPTVASSVAARPAIRSAASISGRGPAAGDRAAFECSWFTS